MSKSLSNGTLSLRFMQNALRRQQMQEVELARAEVKDEGRWEVGQDVKEAWGIGRAQQSDSVAYEASYIPFLFSFEHEESTSQVSKPLRRRVFNKKGLDVSPGESDSQQQQDGGNDDDVPATEDEQNIDDHGVTQVSKGRRYKVHAKPTTISSESLNRRSLKGFDGFEPPTRDSLRSTKARDAIFSSGDVGTDLRRTKKVVQEDVKPTLTQAAKTKDQNTTLTTGFLKPMGVDEPASRTTTSVPIHTDRPPKTSRADIIDGARKKKKRLHEAADSSDEATRKKKKRTTPSKNTADIP